MTAPRIAIAVAIAAACIASSGRAEVLSLHAAWYKAVNSEPIWRMAQADASIEREESNKARAGLLPQIGASGSSSRNSVTQTGGSGASNIGYGSSSTSLSLRQPLFRMQSYAEYQRATAKSEGAEFRLGNEAQSLAVRVAQAYFEVLYAEDAIRYSSFLEKSLTTQVDAARQAFRNGSGTRIEIDEARARLAMATADRQAAENAGANARKRLSAIIGTAVTELLPLDEERARNLRLMPASFAEWMEIARLQSPELASAAKAVEEASWSKTTARAGHLPTLDLVMSSTRAQSDTISTIDNKYTTNAIGIQLNVPLFSGGYVAADAKQAAARYQRALANQENAERQMETRLLQEFNGVLQGEERLVSLATALEASEEALRSTHHGVSTGSRTSLDVLNAERQLYATRLDISKSRYDWLMSRIRLQALAGRLGETEIKEVSGLLSLSAKRDELDATPETPKKESSDHPRKSRDSIIRTAPKLEAELPSYIYSPKGDTAATQKADLTQSANVEPATQPPPSQTEPNTSSAIEPAAEKPADQGATAANATTDNSTTRSGIGKFLSSLFGSSAQSAPKTLPVTAETAASAVEVSPQITRAEPVAETSTPETLPSAAVADQPPFQAKPDISTPPARSAPIIPRQNSGAYVVALGAYGNPDNVTRLLGSTEKIGVAVYTEILRNGLTRVRAGPFATRQAAKKTLDKLSASGIAGVLDKR